MVSKLGFLAVSIIAIATVSAANAEIASKAWVQEVMPAAQVQTDWNASSGMGQILNKPTIPTTAADVGAVPTSRTVNGNALTADVTVTGAQVPVTGYEKAASAAAIAATDTVNQAIGKLEKALDGKQATLGANAYDAYGAAAAVEGKLDDGASGYDIDAKTLKVQGKDVQTQLIGTAPADAQSNSTDAGKNVVIGNDGKFAVGGTIGALAAKDTISNADVASGAAIADSKISATGAVASGNTGLVTGGTVYTEVRPSATNAAASGTGYLGAPASTSAATNIAALDTALKAIHPNTGEVKVPSGSSTSSTLVPIWVE